MNSLKAFRVARASQLRNQKHFSQYQPLLRDDRPKSTKGLKPTILGENPPPPEEQSEDVKEHNRTMKDRANKASTQIENEDAYKDKISPTEKKNEDEKGN